ncbi:hypothetical protein [Streptomyces sp. b94]|nr:hypothetical protein [Streptomyces sp. b94]
MEDGVLGVGTERGAVAGPCPDRVHQGRVRRIGSSRTGLGAHVF